MKLDYKICSRCHQFVEKEVNDLVYWYCRNIVPYSGIRNEQGDVWVQKVPKLPVQCGFELEYLMKRGKVKI